MSRNRRYNNYNGGYNRNNNNNIRVYKNNFNAADEGFNARNYKKKDIEITDLNGKVYIISGNFASTFAVEMVGYIDKIEQFKSDKLNYTAAPELINILKEWCLKLLNHNIDGKEYDMSAVNAGFNDVDVLLGLFAYINNKLRDFNRETIAAANKGGE